MAAPKGNKFAEANSKFKEEYIDLARNYCKLGATDKELAENFEVSESTINLWKISHDKFSESVYEGKDYFDSNQVAGALKSRALGYSHPEEKVFCNMGQITTHTVLKHYPPDVKACEILLNNRDPKRWKTKQEVEHSIMPSFEVTLKKK